MFREIVNRDKTIPTTESEAIKYLESLVHTRFTIKILELTLNEKFGVKNIKLFNDSKRKKAEGNSDELPDYNFICNINNGKLYIDVDIYMLPTRAKEWYITEVGYEFQPF